MATAAWRSAKTFLGHSWGGLCAAHLAPHLCATPGPEGSMGGGTLFSEASQIQQAGGHAAHRVLLVK